MTLDVDRMRGKLIIETGCMKGGKTEALVACAQRIKRHSKFGLVVFNNSLNVRDGVDQIASENNSSFPAIPADVHDPHSIIREVYEQDKEQFQDVVIIDEGNFFDYRLVPVIQQLKKEKRVVIVGGLDLNFRGEPFGPMAALKLMADEVRLHHAYCQMVRDGKVCSNPASFTVRLVRAEEADLHARVSFRKGDNMISGLYYFAPYYHPTIIVEKKSVAAQLPLVVYTTACKDCFQIPGKDKTFQVYKTICRLGAVKQEKLRELMKDTHELPLILDFLKKENWIIESRGRLRAVPFMYHMESGMFISAE